MRWPRSAQRAGSRSREPPAGPYVRGAKISCSTRAAAQLGERVTDLHGLLDEVAQGSRTTAIIRAWTGKEFKDVVAGSGERGLDRVIKSALQGSEHLAQNIKDLDAEANALAEIARMRWKPYAGASSRPVCPWCQNELFDSGAKLVGPFAGMTILNKFRRTPFGERLTGQWQFIW